MSLPAHSRRTHKRKIVAVAAGVAIAAAVAASASTLGGAAAHTIGADTASAASVLTNGVTVAWDTTFSTAKGEYVVTGVTVSTKGGELIPAGADVKLTILGNDAGKASDATNALGEFKATVATSATAGVTSVSTWSQTPAIDAHDITGVAVVVDGNSVAATPAG